jgi:hypothetical protein
MAVGALLWLGRRGRAAFGRTEEHVSLDKLHPGQSMQIVTIVPPTRRERRAARRGDAVGVRGI